MTVDTVDTTKLWELIKDIKYGCSPRVTTAISIRAR